MAGEKKKPDRKKSAKKKPKLRDLPGSKQLTPEQQQNIKGGDDPPPPDPFPTAVPK